MQELWKKTLVVKLFIEVQRLYFKKDSLSISVFCNLIIPYNTFIYNALHQLFSIFDIRLVLFSDNGPQFEKCLKS